MFGWFSSSNDETAEIKKRQDALNENNVDNERPIVRQGWMQKKGYYMPSYKRRWFILQDDRLYYYSSHQEHPRVIERPRGYIKLATASVKRDKDDPLFIGIDTPSRDFWLLCRDAIDCEEWISALITAKGGKVAAVATNVQQQTPVDERTGVAFRIKPNEAPPAHTMAHANNPSYATSTAAANTTQPLSHAPIRSDSPHLDDHGSGSASPLYPDTDSEEDAANRAAYFERGGQSTQYGDWLGGIDLAASILPNVAPPAIDLKSSVSESCPQPHASAVTLQGASPAQQYGYGPQQQQNNAQIAPQHAPPSASYLYGPPQQSNVQRSYPAAPPTYNYFASQHPQYPGAY